MVYCYRITQQGLTNASLTDALKADPSSSYWIDLTTPSQEVVHEVEKALRINVLTREEIAHSGPISRLYQENDGLFVTMTAVANAETPFPNRTPVSFVLTGRHLVTLRYEDLVAFRSFHSNCMFRSSLPTSKEAVLFSLLDEMIDRLSDLLERASAELDRLSQVSFSRQVELDKHLSDIGKVGDITSKIREGLLSMKRGVTYLAEQGPRFSEVSVRAANKSLNTLLDQSNFLVNQITFVLDATLGVISIEQNRTIKIFSVVAVIFLPPTLIASIYGMNFEILPELKWDLGYPLALLAMLVSAVLPYWVFKKMRWL